MMGWGQLGFSLESSDGSWRALRVLDRFAIDWSLCMYCGSYIDECPFDALEWADGTVAAGPSLLEDLTSPRTP